MTNTQDRIADEPLDTDAHWPRPLSREDARARLAALAPDAAQAIWTELIAPLYDQRKAISEWPRQQCRRCNVPHPEAQTRIRPFTGHRMRCPKYVGPLEHRAAHSNFNFLGNLRHDCTCGLSYPDRDDDGNVGVCPDAAIDWRGPRPAGAPDA